MLMLKSIGSDTSISHTHGDCIWKGQQSRAQKYDFFSGDIKFSLKDEP